MCIGMAGRQGVHCRGDSITGRDGDRSFLAAPTERQHPRPHPRRGHEDEVVAFARTQFDEFNEREALVRASNAFPAAGELRARGPLEGRPAFRRGLAEITKNLSEWEKQGSSTTVKSAPASLRRRDKRAELGVSRFSIFSLRITNTRFGVTIPH